MKKKLLISLLAAVCVLSLTACAKTPKPPSDTKIEVPPASQIGASQPEASQPETSQPEASQPETSQPEDLNPLTLEQVKTIIQESEGQGGFSTICVALNTLQKPSISKREDYGTLFTYLLSDNTSSTHDSIVVDNFTGYVCYQRRDDEGHLISEEVLYNSLADFDTGGLTLERVREILTLSETEAAKEGITQSEYVCHELQKIQEPRNIVMPMDGGGFLDCDAYSLPMENISSRKIVLMKVPNGQSNMAGYREIGDTILYLVEMDAHGNYLHKELLYEARYKA